MRRSGTLSHFSFWLICFCLLLGCQQSQDQAQKQAPNQEQANQSGYKVIAVKDGDTIELLKDEKPLRVRLQGVDCPEKNQDFGTRAQQFTSELVFGKFVQLVVHDVDRYGRTVGEIILADGRNLGYELMKNGFAWHYTDYSKDQKLAELEVEARAEKRGLWAGPSPVAPWDFRKSRKGGTTTSTQKNTAASKAPAKTPKVAAKGVKVFICQSKGSKTFHTDQACYLLEQCKSTKATITLTQALRERRNPCKNCAD